MLSGPWMVGVEGGVDVMSVGVVAILFCECRNKFEI
jgi:hypothetical protein